MPWISRSAGPLPAVCDPFKAGRYLCDAIGTRTTSSAGYSIAYDTTGDGVSDNCDAVVDEGGEQPPHALVRIRIYRNRNAVFP